MSAIYSISDIKNLLSNETISRSQIDAFIKDGFLFAYDQPDKAPQCATKRSIIDVTHFDCIDIGHAFANAAGSKLSVHRPIDRSDYHVVCQIKNGFKFQRRFSTISDVRLFFKDSAICNAKCFELLTTQMEPDPDCNTYASI